MTRQIDINIWAAAKTESDKLQEDFWNNLPRNCKRNLTFGGVVAIKSNFEAVTNAIYNASLANVRSVEDINKAVTALENKLFELTIKKGLE